jgi:SNF2 family DNA or RNA helicase
MPRIFDNLDLKLVPALQESLRDAHRADFCVGYFNLRGWRQIDEAITPFLGGDGNCCRLLVGMQKLPKEEVHAALSLRGDRDSIDWGKAARLRKQAAEEFRNQLMIGAPTNSDEKGLKRLSEQIKKKQLKIKLYLRNTLHAKLYLTYQKSSNLPIVGFLGSSNLTLSGLRYQGELNIDVLDHDATQKLSKWFEDRWQDQYCIDISDDLATIIDESWMKERSPYHLYLKIAYHLSQEAIAGISEYRIPREFKNQLFDFQVKAVQIAARLVTKNGGVLIGDVVGLGKTLIGTALAKTLQDDLSLETLIICPKNLVSMWEDYVHRYRLLAEVISVSQVQNVLPELRRFRIVLIDESHNLRNRSGKRYRAIQEYIAINESKCILLTATPYNKTYLDLSAQLRLFVPEDQNLGIRPEALIHRMGGESEFQRRFQVLARSLAAFEHSESADDWRDLMRLYMIRRTRGFIKKNYAEEDETKRKYLEFSDGSRSYFPTRRPRTARFDVAHPERDPYARLYSDDVVGVLNTLYLPRYGLGNYEAPRPKQKPTEDEKKILGQLSRSGRRLMGFCRTNLFKRLESSGFAFIQSLDRHVLRNYVYLYAIENGLDIPIGTQDAELLDSRNNDEDSDSNLSMVFESDDSEVEDVDEETGIAISRTALIYKKRAAEVYGKYASQYRRRFKWIRASLFKKELEKDLRSDANRILTILDICSPWQADKDTKLETLLKLVQVDHPNEKILLFTQFADTARYLAEALQEQGISAVGVVSGSTENPTDLTWRFSPVSNGKRKQVEPEQELRVLIATDILSEGHNLQDCAIVLNYDLPWAIIRLIQRAGRVDRIGQQSETILCYSFLPAEGVDRLINLRARLRQRLKENAEVVGTDEMFFEDSEDHVIVDLYNEKAGLLDGDEDTEVDLTSEAFQIWNNAIRDNLALKKQIEEMPYVVHATRSFKPQVLQPEGVLLYMRTSEGNDALAYIDRKGESVTQSQLAILRIAACEPDTPGLPRDEQHHELVLRGAELIAEDEQAFGGQLGRKSGARHRVYERLKRYADEVKGSLLESEALLRSIDEIYRYPLRQSAIDRLNRQLKSGIDDLQLAEMVMALRSDDELCLVQEEVESREAQIICSMGLVGGV